MLPERRLSRMISGRIDLKSSGSQSKRLSMMLGQTGESRFTLFGIVL
jgi:hypothetical protein